MNFDRYTQLAQQAVAAAQKMAESRQNAVIEPAHLLATLVVFAASRLHHNSSFYDAYWSVLPPFLAAYWWASASPDVNDTRNWLVLGVIVLWAVRLTGNWVYAFPGLHHEDFRYQQLRDVVGRLRGDTRDDTLEFIGQGMLLNVAAALGFPADDWLWEKTPRG